MKLILKEDRAGPRVLALGTFDGVHRGHRELLRAAKLFALKRKALLRVCTFDRHPMEIFLPSKAPKLLTTVPEKTARIALLGPAELQVLPFTRETANLEPEAFLERLRGRVDLRGIAVGWNYTFGRGGRGTPDLLLADGERHGYPVLVLPPVCTADGAEISSSRIRECLARGETEQAAELMDHAVCYTGRVVEGKHMGRKLGFPTANVRYSRLKMLPAFGVYTCWLEAPGARYPAMANIGTQPTLPSGHVTLEVHVPGASPELYGRLVRVTLLRHLRPEYRFDSPEALIRQLKRDREETEKFFGMA